MSAHLTRGPCTTCGKTYISHFQTPGVGDRCPHETWSGQPNTDGRLYKAPITHSSPVSVVDAADFVSAFGDGSLIGEAVKEVLSRGIDPPGVGSSPPHDDDDDDIVNHPPHYTSHPSGVECIEITEHMNFLLGSAMKYIWRAGLKGGSSKKKTDLEKAIWYLQRELAKDESERRAGEKSTDD